MTSTRGRVLGYIRVSTVEQNTDRQLDGVHVDVLFKEKASGKDANRPELKALLRTAYRGDVVKVHSMDRLARNLRDLEDIVSQLINSGAQVEFLKEKLTFKGEDDHYSKLMLQMLGAFGEFERKLIKARQMEGIKIRKDKGLYKGVGRRREITDAQVETIRARVAAGEKKAKIASDMGISRESIYKYLKAPVLRS